MPRALPPHGVIGIGKETVRNVCSNISDMLIQIDGDNRTDYYNEQEVKVKKCQEGMGY